MYRLYNSLLPIDTIALKVPWWGSISHLRFTVSHSGLLQQHFLCDYRTMTSYARLTKGYSRWVGCITHKWSIHILGIINTWFVHVFSCISYLIALYLRYNLNEQIGLQIWCLLLFKLVGGDLGNVVLFKLVILNIFLTITIKIYIQAIKYQYSTSQHLTVFITFI